MPSDRPSDVYRLHGYRRLWLPDMEHWLYAGLPKVNLYDRSYRKSTAFGKRLEQRARAVLGMDDVPYEEYLEIIGEEAGAAVKLRELVEWAKDQDPDLEIYTLTTCQCCTEEVPRNLRRALVMGMSN